MLTRLAVSRPVAALMAGQMVVLLGWVALTRLSVDLMPAIEYPTVTVTTLYAGAAPEEIETLVTRPLEQVLSGVSGFERLSSRSLEGSSTIRVQFQWDTNLDAAVADMRQAIDRILTNLPEDIESPVIRKYDSNASPILYLALNGDIPPIEMTRLAERTIVPRLERLDGVARVGMRGEVQREIQVQLDRGKLDGLGLGVNEVITALQEENVSRPAGHLQEGHLNVLLRSRGEFTDLDSIRRVVVRRTGDAVVRISDIAEVIDGFEERTELTRLNGEPGIMVYVFQQSGANTIDVSELVHDAVADLNQDLSDVTVTVRLDKANFIRGTIENIRRAAIIGMGLAMLILLLFLGSARSAVIIGISMPLSVLATFVLIYFQGFTLNIVSFGGLALGMGMLVDNSIVVLESIFRKREAEGLTARDAAIEGTREVAGAITASTLTTLVVFVPLLFIDGMAGILLHQLAYVVSFSLVCSLGASLTLTPVLAAYGLGRTLPTLPASAADAAGIGKVLESSHIAHARPQTVRSLLIRVTAPLAWLFNIPARLGRTLFVPVEAVYSRLLAGVMRYPGWAVFPIALIAAATLGLLPRVGTDFLPKTDDGRIGVTGIMSPGIHLDTLDRQTRQLEAQLTELIPEAESFSVFVGDEAEDGDDWNECRFFVQLVPRDEREHSAEDIRQRIMRELDRVAGMKIRANVYSAVPVRGLVSTGEADNVVVLVRGHDRRTAEDLAAAVVRQMEQVDGVVNVERQGKDKRPELSVRIDHDKASLLGIRVQEIAQSVEATIRGSRATVYREDGDEFNVLVRLQESDRSRARDVGDVSLATETGQLVPLKNIASFAPNNEPLTIDRLDRQRILWVTGTVEDRDLGSVIADLQHSLDVIPVPDDFTVEIGGDYEEQQESFQMLQVGLLLAVILMYMIMAAQFESLRSPLLILASLPLAGVGVVLVLVFWDTTLNVQSFIGVIVLAGIVVNNAIVLVDYTNQLRTADPSLRLSEIIHRAGVRRFRPIVMTTLTSVVGMLPVALGLGEGGELQAPMARVVIGGLVSGTLMTLFAIPLLLRVCSRDRITSNRPSGAVAADSTASKSLQPV